jgi:hypothetical protein
MLAFVVSRGNREGNPPIVRGVVDLGDGEVDDNPCVVSCRHRMSRIASQEKWDQPGHDLRGLGSSTRKSSLILPGGWTNLLNALHVP